MNQIRTRGIVLRRVNYVEADRIVTFLTPDLGQVSAMVKGARRQGSKLAGGIELFSENDITLIRGKGELFQLISGRMLTQYSRILEDYDRVGLGYEAVKHVHKAANQFNEPKLYDLLKTVLETLDEPAVSVELIEAWFKLNLLRILGQQPNLTHDIDNQKLDEDSRYTLLPDDGALKADEQGVISAGHIKAWRVLLTADPFQAARIKGVAEAVAGCLPAISHLFEYQIP